MVINLQVVSQATDSNRVTIVKDFEGTAKLIQRQVSRLRRTYG